MQATASPAELRDEVREWLHDQWSREITVREWWRRLADAGLAMPGCGGATQEVVLLAEGKIHRDRVHSMFRARPDVPAPTAGGS